MKQFIVLFLSVFLMASCSGGKEIDTEQAVQNERDILNERREEKEAKKEAQAENVEYESESNSESSLVETEELSIQDEVDRYLAMFKKVEGNFKNTKVVDLQNFYYEPKLESGENKYTVTFGVMELSNYYNYGYRDSKDTHQAFRIIDFNGETIHAYANRDLEMYDILMEAINNNDTTQFFTLTELNHMDSGSQHMAEIVGIFTELQE